MNENYEVYEEVEAPAEEAVVEAIQDGDKPEKVFGVTSLIFGILSLAAFLIPLPLSSYFPLIGVIFAVIDKAKNKKMTGVGKGGLICSIVAYAITVITLTVTLITIILVYVGVFVFGVYMATEGY
ncbi:MAG: hypothetical protein IJ437_06375 [Clostridia bacterium]|nr:hypothetical protein [Clostridia bacterium]